ncbi:hypothetical protein [Actinacidiphila alni]|uniref:hypothetical protein n=1 Tax=Actinacidiphila alni TaxID=380248 RepID=UPI00345504F6
MRIADIAHSTTDRAGFLVQLIALAKQKGYVGHPGDGTNPWNAVHIRDVASLFRLALGDLDELCRVHQWAGDGGATVMSTCVTRPASTEISGDVPRHSDRPSMPCVRIMYRPGRRLKE